MTVPVVVRLKPLYGSEPRWHVATFLGIPRCAWLGPACGRFVGFRYRPLQITYGAPTCKWCKTLRMHGEPVPSGRFAARLA